MSYLALARKYRPRRFEDVIGQDQVVRALIHALDHDRLPSAILLTGTRGVGKTALARIIAKGLNCETGVSSQPCGVCGNCKEVNQGRFVDLLEIDAASDTGADELRAVIDNALYAPARGRYKVYLIEEFHMLSKSTFNALLETIEEPPRQVKFILTKTDPQKLLATIFSRCQQFNLKRLSDSVICEQTVKVLTEEGRAFELDAVREIARWAHGSMRDALSLTDEVNFFAGSGTLSRGTVEDLFGPYAPDRNTGELEMNAPEILDSVLKNAVSTMQSTFEHVGSLSGNAPAPERTAVVHLGAAFISAGFSVYAEPRLTAASQARIDLVAANPYINLAVAVEIKQYGQFEPYDYLNDINRLSSYQPQAAIRSDGKDECGFWDNAIERWGLLLVQAFDEGKYPALWLKQTELSESEFINAYDEAASDEKGLRRYREGCVQLAQTIKGSEAAVVSCHAITKKGIWENTSPLYLLAAMFRHKDG